jgi:hypothetical protein
MYSWVVMTHYVFWHAQFPGAWVKCQNHHWEINGPKACYLGSTFKTSGAQKNVGSFRVFNHLRNTNFWARQPVECIWVKMITPRTKNLLLAPKTSHRLWNLPSVFTFQNSRHWEYIGSFSNTIFVALSLSFLDFLRTGSNTEFRELMGIRAVTTPYCSRCCFAKMRFSHEEGCTISAQCQQKRQQKARNGTNGFGAVG